MLQLASFTIVYTYFRLRNDCVCTTGLFPHLNFRNVRPRLPRTERVQIAMAADSFACGVCLETPRARTVLRTRLIQLQKRLAIMVRLVPTGILLNL